MQGQSVTAAQSPAGTPADASSKLRPSFQLRKWYLDIVAPDGAAIIGYSADLRWGLFHTTYSAAMISDAIGAIEPRSSLRLCAEPTRTNDVIEWQSPAPRRPCAMAERGVASRTRVVGESRGRGDVAMPHAVRLCPQSSTAPRRLRDGDMSSDSTSRSARGGCRCVSCAGGGSSRITSLSCGLSGAAPNPARLCCTIQSMSETLRSATMASVGPLENCASTTAASCAAGGDNGAAPAAAVHRAHEHPLSKKSSRSHPAR